MSRDRVSVAVPSQLKTEAEAIFAQLGITPSRAVREFYERVVACGALPFGSPPTDAQATSVEAMWGALPATEAGVVEPIPGKGVWEKPTSSMPSQSFRR